MLQSGGYDAQWQPVLTDWIRAVCAPLTTQGISLSQLTAKDKQVEMEFYLPIASPLRADALDALIREYDPLSAGCPPLNFRQVQGC
jgi:exodeoxyribonuclease V beta subunit